MILSGTEFAPTISTTATLPDFFKLTSVFNEKGEEGNMDRWEADKQP
jgi:hypothetical protein